MNAKHFFGVSITLMHIFLESHEHIESQKLYIFSMIKTDIQRTIIIPTIRTKTAATTTTMVRTIIILIIAMITIKIFTIETIGYPLIGLCGNDSMISCLLYNSYIITITIITQQKMIIIN